MRAVKETRASTERDHGSRCQHPVIGMILLGARANPEAVVSDATRAQRAWGRGARLAVIAQRVYRQVWVHNLLERAAALSYYFLFALFPTLLFLTALVGLLPFPHLMERLVDYF